MTYHEVLKRIAMAKRDKSTQLHLNSNQLTSLPAKIGSLNQLQELDVSGNQLTSLPAEIGQLTQLEKLKINNNSLTSLPAEIGLLKQLQELDVSGNRLTSLPAEIGLLKQLRKLFIFDNRLTSLPAEIGLLKQMQWLYVSATGLTSLPAEIIQLTQLHWLDVSQNQLTSLPAEIGLLNQLQELAVYSNQLTSLPAEIGLLKQLQTLNISQNQLTSLPAEIGLLKQLRQLYIRDNELRDLPAEITQLTQLQTFDISYNPLISPPPEIVSQGLTAIQEYLRKQKEQQWVSKLLVVGQGGAGKTNLLRRLLGEDFHEQEETTRGIAIRSLALLHPALPDVTIQLNTWDFAGQEIEHATHQFFLTNRSLFLIVWNARHGFEQSRIHYWLETIRTRAGSDVAIILVAAHADQRTPDLPLADLQRDYPQIIASFAVSNKTGEGIAELRQALTTFAADPKVLPLMGERWPRTWLDAANALRAAPEEEKRISSLELRKRLSKHKLTPEESDILTQWLHELGDILHFRDNEELKDLVILKPQWVTQHIAQVFKSEDVIRLEGILTRAEMETLWPDFDRELQERLLDLMEQFDLSYRIPENPEVSLVVERVPYEEPADYPPLWESFRSREHCREVTMKYELSSIPAGIPTWFIARQHRFSLHKHWRYGVLFGDDPANPRHLGLLQTHPPTNTLRLTVRGPFPVNFFALLKDGLEETLKRFPGLGITRKVPCPGHNGKPCPHEFDYDNLEKRILIKPTIECPITANDVDVEEMLTGIGWDAQDKVLEILGGVKVKMDQHHADVLTHIEGGADRVIETISDKITLAQREFLKEFAEVQRFPESRCPNVFILRDKKVNVLQRALGQQKMELQLLCQEPGDWHPLTEKDKRTGKGKPCGVYDIDNPAQWLQDMAPYVLKLVKFLKYATPFASPLIGLSFSKEDAEELEKHLKLMEKLVEKFPEMKEDLRDQDYARHVGLKEDARMVEGAQLRVLRQLLELKDPAQEWGGLQRVRTPEGHYLWVCEHHAQQYKR